ncbi:hypothetical protein H072_3083 [Dactylellina haptotyla CBS 200.50]|uniref:Rhodopsin domain-containing protein n=1 Tax=Dactylellina haptotyla (strain CBS 200.50) TaxID=1284197 RepID=S8BU14_DACHA|nr:hypothetical protein H072_3083 [Dactylellina haptotyla CBS 200.50]
MSATTTSVSPWSTLPDNLRPLLDPPEGVIPDFHSRDNLGWQIVLATAITLPLAVIACGLRFFTRLHLIQNFRVDDYLLLFTIISALVFQACNLYSVSLGLGKQMWDVPWSLMSPVLKWFLATELTYFVAICGCKLTILAFYLRFIMNKTQKYIIWGFLTAIVIYNLLSICILVFSCKPIQALWDWNYDQNKCLYVDPVYFINAALNTITDIAILILPMRTLWKLKMPISQKVGLIAVFTTGGFIIIITIIRMVQLTSIPNGGDNITRGFVGPSLWSAVEVNLSMVCASIPALKPFIVRYLGRYFSKWASGHGYFKNTNGQNDSAAIQLSNARRTNNSQAKKNSLFYKGSVVTTTEITAAHSDENRLFDEPNDLNSIDVELGSQTSLHEQQRTFENRDLKIMKTSNVTVDSRRISAEIQMMGR